MHAVVLLCLKRLFVIVTVLALEATIKSVKQLAFLFFFFSHLVVLIMFLLDKLLFQVPDSHFFFDY